MGELFKAAQGIYDECVEIRRTIHQNPEIGRKEFKTSELIREKLRLYGVDQIDSPVPTAVVALIKGTKEGPGKDKCLAIRADIDALPIQEETDVPYKSQVPDMMHACGHDLHATMLLGTAKLLCERRREFAGTIKLIFQHSEDTLPGGAKELVEKGVMENPHVDAIFGMHILPEEGEIGRVKFMEGPVTTSVDLFDVTVNGVGGHGSTPQLTKDPILAACQMVVLLQQIQSRYVDPLETVIFPVCSFHSGDAPNVIPGQARFSGIARAYVDHVRDDVTKQVYDIAKGMESIAGVQVDINHYEGYPACYNDEKLTRMNRSAVAAELGEDMVYDMDKPMSFSEDFSYFTKMTGTPGVYVLLAAGYEGELQPLHNSKMLPDEKAMPYGIAAMCASALNYMKSM